VSDTRWLDPEESKAWRGWLVASQLLHAQIGRDLQSDSGLSEADYRVLVDLSEAAEHRIRMSELALRLDWSKSRLSHHIARMEARGLVRREDCPSDARGSFAILTPGGREELERAAPGHVASVRRHFIDLLDRKQLGQLVGIVETLADHLRGQSTGAAAVGEAACPLAASEPADS
jgi:DNA-binding MarR family transcriptional regulator